MGLQEIPAGLALWLGPLLSEAKTVQCLDLQVGSLPGRSVPLKSLGTYLHPSRLAKPNPRKMALPSSPTCPVAR